MTAFGPVAGPGFGPRPPDPSASATRRALLQDRGESLAGARFTALDAGIEYVSDGDFWRAVNEDDFVPASIPGLSLWLDADDLVSLGDGVAVENWDDPRENGMRATQATAGSRPTVQTAELNGHAIVRFDGTDDRLAAGVASDWRFLHDGTGCTVFVVAKTSSANPNAIQTLAATQVGSFSQRGLALFFDDRAAQTRDDTTLLHIASGTAPVLAQLSPANTSCKSGRWHVVETAWINGAAADDILVQADGGLGCPGSAMMGANTPSTLDPTGTLTLGSTPAGGAYLNGDIAYVLVYNRKLTAAEREQVRRFLARRFALPVLDLGAATTLEDGAGAGGTHNGFPGLTRTDTGRLIATYRSGANHGGSAGAGVIVQHTSDDDGLTWTDAATVISDATRDYRTAVPTTMPDGTLLLSSWFRGPAGEDRTRACVLFRSTDDGATWTQIANPVDGFTAIVGTEGPPVRLLNGEWLWPVYGYNTAEAFTSTKVLVSTNKGTTWAVRSTVSGVTDSRSYTESTIAQRVDGTVVLLIRDNTNSALVIATSADNGATWGAVGSSLVTATSPPRVAKSKDGAWVVVMRRANVTSSGQLLFSSTDEGVSWQLGQQISTVASEYGQIVIDRKGNAVVVHATTTSDTNADVYALRGRLAS